jgi:thiol-disulfide isomerase/thioredoxin
MMRFLAVFCGLGMILATAGLAAEEGVRVGQRPPAFNVADLTGQPQTVKQYAGRILVLHFWATWCPYCRGEIPKLVTVQREFGPKGVSIVAVSVDRDVAQLKQFVGNIKLPYAVIADAESAESLVFRYRVRGIPVTYIIGRDGRIAARFMGASDLVGVVRRILERPATAGSS